MITKSNPFLRNDYYPDQNDIDELNTRINEVQSDVDLLAISVNEKTEAVNGKLNNLQNDYNESFKTEALKANTVDFNVLNVNVQATIKDLNAINTYTENLIVNKPVQDLSLRTPHLENTTSLNGNFYAPNIIGGKLDNIQFENTQNFKAVNIEADKVKANVANLNVLNAINIEADVFKANVADLNKVTANTIDLNVLNAINIEANEVKANKLIGDFSAEPISSSAVVGYDGNGQLIPIRASYHISLPENAGYLKTDAQGVARKGTSESEIVQSTNLIQAGAVQNMYDAVNANFNSVSNSFNSVNENFNSVSNSFNSVNENFNNIESNLNNIESNIKTINDFIFKDIYIPEYGLFNSSSPVNYRNAEDVELYGSAQGGIAIPDGGGLIKFDSSTNLVTFGFSGACRGIKDASNMFNNCTKLNQYVSIPNTVEKACYMFYGCSNFNRNITIPNSVTDTSSMFMGCTNLNQNISIPNSVVYASSMFNNCTKLNQNISIPNSVTAVSSMFRNCVSLNQNIIIPNSVTAVSSMFINCTKLNQNIAIPNSVTDTSSMFMGCVNLNQNIAIPNSVLFASNMFNNCVNLNQDIYIYFQSAFMDNMFMNTKVNLHNVHIPSSVPKDPSNSLYNCLVNGVTGVTFAPKNIYNDLPVDPVVWPPFN